MLNLLYGQVSLDSGSVTYDGQTLAQEQIARSVSYILQDSYIFDGCHWKTISPLGRPLDKLKMEQVLDRVNLAF